jgi:type IV secretion system protein VirB6
MNKFIKFITLILIAYLPLIYSANACDNPSGMDIDCNNSCIDTNQNIFTVAGAYTTTLGFYAAVDKGFDMTSLYSSGADTCNTPVNINNGTIKFKYDSIFNIGSDIINLKVNQTKWVGLSYFRAIADTDKICVQVMLPTGWTTMGCKYLSYEEPSLFTAGCIGQGSCSERGARYSKSPFPITAIMMQCIKESINKIFVDPSVCKAITGTPQRYIALFTTFQQSMRSVVQAALTLYIIFIGIKISLGRDIPKKADIFMYIIKMVLVIYFSVGFGNQSASNTSSTGSESIASKGGAQIVKVGFGNGLQDFLIPAFQTLSYTLAELVLNSTGSNQCGIVNKVNTDGTITTTTSTTVRANSTLCYYDPEDYKDGFEYLALWDSLDCRLAYYLGFSNALNTAALITQSIIISMIMPALMGFQLMFMAFLIMFFIFLLSLTIYFVNTYIVALIATSIVAYLGPLFVPMALFKQTKGYFDAWLRLLFSFSLQPAVLIAFIALMMTIFDGIMFGSCCWDKVAIPTSAFGSDAISGNLNNINMYYLQKTTDTNCTNSPGYLLYSIKAGQSVFESIEAVFFSLTVLDPSVSSRLFKGMSSLVLFAWLFYYFAQMLSGFAADLTGGPSLGALAVSPTAVIDAAGKMAKAAVQYKLGNHKGALKTMTGVNVSKGGDGGIQVSRGGGESKVSSVQVTKGDGT